MSDDHRTGPSFVCPLCGGVGLVTKLYIATAGRLPGRVLTTSVSASCGMCSGSGFLPLGSPPGA